MKYVIILSKIFITAALLAWLLKSNRLDLTTLQLIVEQKQILVFTVLLWVIGPLLMGGLRWAWLLKGFGIQIPFTRILNYQAIGLFFNTAIPGAVGGDLVKGLYLLKNKEANSRASLIVTLLLDRLFGIFGLFIVGVFTISVNLTTLQAHPRVWPLAVSTFAIFLGVLAGLLWVAAPLPREKDPINRLLKLPLPGFGYLLAIYEAVSTLKHNPLLMIKAIVLSATNHTVVMLFFWYLVTLISKQSMTFNVFSALYPLGILTTSIPLAPGGMGIGHTTFDQLFSLVGVSGGANVFNVFVLGQLCLNCLGLIPFLAMKYRLNLLRGKVKQVS